MMKSYILLNFSLLFLFHASQIQYSGISSYYSDNYVKKSLLNEMNSLNKNAYSFNYIIKQDCSPISKMLFFLKNKVQVNPINTSNYNLKISLNQVTNLNYKYNNGVYKSSNTLPLNIVVNTVNYGQKCNKMSTTNNSVKINLNNVSFTKILTNNNENLSPQITFAASLTQENKSSSSTDSQITKVIKHFESKLIEKINTFFQSYNFAPLVPNISFQLSYLFQLNTTLVSLPSNPMIVNNNYISVLDASVYSILSSYKEREQYVTSSPSYFTNFKTESDAQFFISAESIYNLFYITIPNSYTPIILLPTLQISFHDFREIFPEVADFYPETAQISSKLYYNSPTFYLNSLDGHLEGNVLIMINGSLMVEIKIHNEFTINSIQQASKSQPTSLIFNNNLKQLGFKEHCNCGYLNVNKLNSFLDFVIFPWINKGNMLNMNIPSFFNDNFNYQTANFQGSNIMLSSNYTS